MLHPVCGVARRSAGIKNPPRYSPGGDDKVPGRALPGSVARFRCSVLSGAAQNTQEREGDLARVGLKGKLATTRWLAASHRCVEEKHRLKPDHVLDGALVTGSCFVGELFDGGFLFGDPAAMAILADGDLLVHRAQPDGRQGSGAFRAAFGIAGLPLAELGMLGWPAIADRILRGMPAHGASPGLGREIIERLATRVPRKGTTERECEASIEPVGEAWFR